MMMEARSLDDIIMIDDELQQQQQPSTPELVDSDAELTDCEESVANLPLVQEQQPSVRPPQEQRRKVTFLAHGTLGDHLPAALVCGELARRGYDTVFMAPVSAKYLVKGYAGVRFVDFGISMQEARETTVEGRKLTRLSLINHRPRCLDFFRRLGEEWAPRLLNFLKEEKPDLVVLTIGSLLFLAPLIELLEVPTVCLLANPMHITGEHLPTCGPQLMRTLHVPIFNKLFWHYMTNNMACMMKSVFLHRMKPSPLDATEWERLRRARLPRSKKLDFAKLILCSPHFYPAPKDWDKRVARVIGVAWPPDMVDQFSKTTEVESFLRRHSSKVAYIGFGSMLGVYRENTHRLRVLNACVHACLKAGLSVILSTTGAHDFINPDTDKVLVLGDSELVPHTWLFPKCAVIIHHGGSGTTHTALRAGTPQVLVPFLFPTWYYNGVEQGFWATQVKHAGVGGGLLHANFATPRSILPLVKKALRPETVIRACQVAKQIRAEPDGLPIAVDMLDQVLRMDPRSTGVDLDLAAKAMAMAKQHHKAVTTTTMATNDEQPAAAAPDLAAKPMMAKHHHKAVMATTMAITDEQQQQPAAPVAATPPGSSTSKKPRPWMAMGGRRRTAAAAMTTAPRLSGQ